MTLERINTFFYFGLVISFILFLLPGEYKMAVYTPNLLGWSMLILFCISIITYFWLLVIDYKKKNYRKLTRRTLFLVTVVGIAISYWYYQVYALGNL